MLKFVKIDESLTIVSACQNNNLHENVKRQINFAIYIWFVEFFSSNILFLFRVLVMGDGEILEFDEPNLLIQNADSYFYHLASQEFSDQE